MSQLMHQIDGRTRLAGANKLEILLFSLGAAGRARRRETYGINVFKVREVMRAPELTRAPDMPAAVEGIVSLRGTLVPVIDLAKYAGVESEAPPEIMIATEYNGHTQGFLVEAVDNILRLDWSSMRVPPEMLSTQAGGFVTAVTELDDGRLVMMIDVERILSETTRVDDQDLFRAVPPLGVTDRTILFADDSSVARKQITRTLEALGVGHVSAINGSQAWVELERIAQHAEASGRKPSDPRGADRCRDARDGRLRSDFAHQVRSALLRHSGDHALVAVGLAEPAPRTVGGRRRVRVEVRAAAARRSADAAVGGAVAEIPNERDHPLALRERAG